MARAGSATITGTSQWTQIFGEVRADLVARAVTIVHQSGDDVEIFVSPNFGSESPASGETEVFTLSTSFTSQEFFSGDRGPGANPTIGGVWAKLASGGSTADIQWAVTAT